MNISSTLRPTYAAPQGPVGGPSSSSSTDVSPQTDRVDFTTGLERGGSFAAGLAGPIAGIKLGWKAGIEIAFRTGNYEAGPILLASAAVGGVVGYLAGQHAPNLAGQAGAFLAEQLGGSADVGRALGAAATGTALGGAAFGTVGAGVGAAVSIGTGVFHQLRA